MSIFPLSNVSSRYGAPMGRRSYRGDPDTTQKFSLRYVPLDSGGYDSGGAYWGHGGRLYTYESQDGEISGSLRAYDRADAKADVRKLYPYARFF